MVALLLTVGIANLLWNAGVPSAANPVRLSPQTDPFPVIPASTLLHVLPVPSTTNESTRLTLLSIQGLANRGGAQLYLDSDNETRDASSMLSFLVSHYGLSYDVVTLGWVYSHYLPSLAGLVITDPSRPESVNIATMVAALRGAAIAGPDTAASLGRGYGLPVVLDYGASNWSATDSIGAYDRALSELYPRMDPDLLAILPPDRLSLRDYLIATRTFTFYEPQGVLAAPSELAATQRVLAAAARGIPILGWFDSPTLTEENAFVQLASQYGKPIFGSQDVPNLSVLTAFGRNLVRTQPPPPPTPPLENKTYVVVAVPDGDNLDFIAHRMPELWAEPERGTFPIAWSLSPLLADLAPAYLDFYYGTATPNDRFVLGPSGAGYLYPDYLGPGDLAPYLQSTSRYANETGMDVAWLLNAFVASEIPYGPATLSAYVDALHPRGLVLDYDDQAKTQETWMQGGTAAAAPVIRSTQLWTTLDNFYAKVGNAMATWDAGPHFLWVTIYTFRFDLSDASAMVQGLGARRGGDLVVVTPEQLFALMEQDFEARAASRLASSRADPFAATFLAPTLASAQAWLDATNPSDPANLRAFHAYLASTDLRQAGLDEAIAACGLVLVLAAAVALWRPRGTPRLARETLAGARPLLVLAGVFALFLFAIRAGLAANFWSYQWIVVGVVLSVVGRPLRRYLDRAYPRISLPAIVALDLVFVALSLATDVAFALAAIGTVATVDAVLARMQIRPAALVLALCLGTGLGFLLETTSLSFGLLALIVSFPLFAAALPPPRRTVPPGKRAWIMGLVLVLPVGSLAAASNFSIGLRLGLEGPELLSFAGTILVLAPLAGLLAARRWTGTRTGLVQTLAFSLSAVFALALAFSTAPLVTGLLLFACTGCLAVGAEAALRLRAAGPADLAASAAYAVSWIPLLLIFLRMPPVVYSLAIVHLPEPLEVVLYAPEFLIAAIAGVLTVLALVRHRSVLRALQG